MPQKYKPSNKCIMKLMKKSRNMDMMHLTSGGILMIDTGLTLQGAKPRFSATLDARSTWLMARTIVFTRALFPPLRRLELELYWIFAKQMPGTKYVHGAKSLWSDGGVWEIGF